MEMYTSKQRHTDTLLNARLRSRVKLGGESRGNGFHNWPLVWPVYGQTGGHEVGSAAPVRLSVQLRMLYMPISPLVTAAHSNCLASVALPARVCQFVQSHAVTCAEPTPETTNLLISAFNGR